MASQRVMTIGLILYKRPPPTKPTKSSCAEFLHFNIIKVKQCERRVTNWGVKCDNNPFWTHHEGQRLSVLHVSPTRSSNDEATAALMTKKQRPQTWFNLSKPWKMQQESCLSLRQKNAADLQRAANDAVINMRGWFIRYLTAATRGRLTTPAVLVHWPQVQSGSL